MPDPACPSGVLYDTIATLCILILTFSGHAVYTYIEEYFSISGRLDEGELKKSAPPASKSADVAEFLKCSVCMLNERSVRFECGHVPCCTDCFARLQPDTICPVCRQPSGICLKTYL